MNNTVILLNKFLIEENIRNIFIHNLIKSKGKKNLKYFTHKILTNNLSISYIIETAFMWMGTPEGHDFWKEKYQIAEKYYK